MQGVTRVARRNGGWLTRPGNLFTIIPSLIDSLGITAGDIVMSSSSIRFRAGFFGFVLAIVVLIAVLAVQRGICTAADEPASAEGHSVGDEDRKVIAAGKHVRSRPT